MATATERVLATVVLLTVHFVYCSAQDGGCSPPAGILTTGDGKHSNNVPTILTSVGPSICKIEHSVLDHTCYHIRFYFNYRYATKDWWSGNGLVDSVQ